MQQYANNGRSDPAVYASNMRADRDLKLSEYEVFRFGAAELQDRQQAREMFQRFDELFAPVGSERFVGSGRAANPAVRCASSAGVG